MNKINLIEKLEQINEYWTPKIIGELNGQFVKLAKLNGDFVRHKHDNEDELFLVVKGKLQLEFDDKTIELKENEICIVPKGVYHKPIAKDEVHILLFEPKSTINTGEISNELTKAKLEHI